MSKRDEKTTYIGLRVPVHVKQRAAEIAKQQQRDLSGQVLKWILEGLDREKVAA